MEKICLGGTRSLQTAKSLHKMDNLSLVICISSEYVETYSTQHKIQGNEGESDYSHKTTLAENLISGTQLH